MVEHFVHTEGVTGSNPVPPTISREMVYLYILQSLSSGRFYTGVTERIQSREAEHNDGQTKSTRTGRPWKLVYSEQFASRPEALARERQIKSWKSHRSIQELIDSQV